MKGIKIKNTLLILFVTGLSIWGYYLFLNSKYFIIFDFWVKKNKTLFVIYLSIYKIISVLWPPLTGGLATLASIPFLGWVNAYLIDLIGSILGGIMAYFLGKKYGLKILVLLFDRNVVEKIKKIKVRKDKEIEAVFLYRIFFGSTIIEAIYYGAGFLNISFKNFIIAATASHMLIGIPSYYFTKNIIEGKNVILIAISFLIGIPFFVKFKKRHFE